MNQVRVGHAFNLLQYCLHCGLSRMEIEDGARPCEATPSWLLRQRQLEATLRAARLQRLADTVIERPFSPS